MSNVVHILGGGIAGITAAIRLTEFGFFPVIIEKNKYLGGRTRSFIDGETGDEIDNGQHLLMSNYKNTRWLMNKIGTSGLVEYQKEMQIPYLIKNENNHIKKKTLKIPSMVFPFHLIGFLNKSDLFTRKEKFFLLKIASLKWKNPQDFSGITVKKFLQIYKQSEAVIEKFWKPFVESALNSTIEESSAQLLIKTLQQSILKGGKYCKMGFPQLGLSYLFSNPAEKFLLKHKAKIEGNLLIKKIKFNENNEVVGLEDEEGSEIPISYLISAIPFKQLKQILPVQVVDKIWKSETLQYEYNSIVSVYLWTEKPIFHEPFYCLVGTKIQWIFNKRVYGGPYKSKYFIYQITVSAAHKFANEASFYIEKVILDELRLFFPQFDIDKVKKMKIIKEKSATPVSGIQNEKNRNVRINQAKNWVIAGDWVQTDLPYTIESAAKSGLKAADYLINELFWD